MNYAINPWTATEPTGYAKAAHDAHVVRQMRATLAIDLARALSRVHAMARELKVLDPDQVMVDLRSYFDPTMANTPVQDYFSDWTSDCTKALRSNSEGVWDDDLTQKGELPSGIRFNIEAE